MTRRVRNLVIAGVGVLLLIGIGTARGGMGARDEAVTVFAEDGRSRTELSKGEAGFSGDSVTDEFAEREFGSTAVRQGGGVTVGGGGGATGGGGAGDSAAGRGAEGEADFSADSSAAVPLPPIPDSERIIKDGRVEVEVPKGGFDRAFAAVLGLAEKVGGQIANSQSSRDEDRASGEVTIRVPVQRFEQLLASADGIGTVEHRQITSQDVSGEYVDLQARVRHLQAQEQFYLGLLGKARVVGDAIAINQHLSTVQAEMEQIRGRLRLIEERTTYSRLTISLYEPGVTPLLTDRLPEQRGVLAQAWHEAVMALQESVGALLVGAFTMAPLIAVALIGWALWRRLRARPAATPDPRPAVEEEQGPLPVG